MNNDQLNETIIFSFEVFLGLDNLTLMHSQRVQKLALFLGKTMKLTSDELNALGVGALLHDVGKQYIPQEILQKHTPHLDILYSLIDLYKFVYILIHIFYSL